MAHAAAPRSENILKQGYLKRSLSSPDFLISASKQLAINIKQKFEPNRWYVFGTRDGHPYLEYFDREERVFTGQPINTIDLSTFRNLSYTLGRTNSKHAFCIYLGNRVLELTAPNRAQMLEWCRCLERNLRQLGYQNQNQREDHHYSEFPVNSYKPKRSASPTGDQFPLPQAQQNTGSAGSEAAENTYEDVNDLTSAKTTDVGAGVPRLPPRPPRPHRDHEEEVFASLDSVTRTSNASDGVYYMFEYTDEDLRLMQAYDMASETQVTVTETTSDKNEFADYDDADALLLPCPLKNDTDSESDDDSEANERCSSLPIIPPKPAESDTSEDSDFVSASFWLRNRKEGANMLLLNQGKSAGNRDLPPVPKSPVMGSAPPPIPLRVESSKSLRSRHCVSMYADVNRKNKTAKKSVLDIEQKSKESSIEPPPLPKRLDIEEVKKQAERDKHKIMLETSNKDSAGISLGKRFDSMNICLDPAEHVEPDDGSYESLEAPKHEVRSNIINLDEGNAVENSIYGQVWNSDSVAAKASAESCKNSRSPEKCLAKGLSQDSLGVNLPSVGACSERNISENSCNSVQEHENYYSDFPTKGDGEKSIANALNCDLRKNTTETCAMSKAVTSPVLPKRKFPPKSNSSSDLTEIYDEVNNNGPYIGTGESKVNNVFGTSDEGPIAPPRRHRKTIAGHAFEVDKPRKAKSDPEYKIGMNVAGSQSPPLPARKNQNASSRKMSEDFIDIPLPLPPRKGAMRTQSVDDASQRNAALRPRSHISVRQKVVPQSGAVTVMNLKQTQVDILRSEIATAGGMVRTVSIEHFKNGMALVECFEKIWIAGWDVKKFPRLYDKFHIGDQLLSINDVEVTDMAFIHKIVKHIKADYVELTVRRLPYASVFAIQRSMEGENLGIKREGGTGEVVYVDPHGLAYRHGLRNKAPTVDNTSVCNWYLTEINNRPLNLFFKDNEIQHRLLAVGRDISIVVQPCDFIQELKKQLKKLKGYKDYLVQ